MEIMYFLTTDSIFFVQRIQTEYYGLSEKNEIK